MKLLFATLLCLLSLTSAHVLAWPRNPTTGKVELRSALGSLTLKQATP